MAQVNSFAEFAGASYPIQSQVTSGVSYGDTLNNYVGTLNVDTAANAPGIGDVRLGVSYGSTSQFVGTLELPVVADVRSGVTYGAGGVEYTGTLSTGSNVTIPAITDVLNGVVYGDNASPITGNVVLPAVDTVEQGVQYGAAGTQLTGTYIAASSVYQVQNQLIQLTRGDDATFEWSTDGSWSASGSVLFGITGLTGSLQVAATIVDASTIRASLTKTQTDALRGTYEYDVQMTDSSGNVSHPVTGQLVVAETETDIPSNTPLPAGRAT